MDLLIEQLGENFGAMGLGVVFVALLTQFLKSKFPDLDPRLFAVGLSLFAGLVYALVHTFVPIEILKNLSAFGALAFTFATGIYKLQK